MRCFQNSFDFYSKVGESMSNILSNVMKSKLNEYEEYFEGNTDSLIGYVMELGYETGTIITNDFYKVKNKGIPKNSFLLIRINSERLLQRIPLHYIIVRVTEPTTTPLSNEVAKTYFEMHKNHMPEIDVFTRAELQWSALNVTVLGSYYDDKNGINFSNDIESYYSPHLYAVYVPTDEMMSYFINYNIKNKAFDIGKIRYTEAMLYKNVNIDVMVSADDFVGSRTALFGKTRMGKSNTVKIIAESIISREEHVGQIIFDLNGEYANANDQDDVSLFDKYQSKCMRFSVSSKAGMESLKVNMYKDLAAGHEIIKYLMQKDGMKADYINAFLNYEILSSADQEELKNESMGDYKRYKRKENVYKCILYKAGFKAQIKDQMYFEYKQEIISEVLDADMISKLKLNKQITIKDYTEALSLIWNHYINVKGKEPFNKEGNKSNYFDDEEIGLMTFFSGKKENGASVSGYKKIQRYVEFHDINSEESLEKIIKYIKNGKTVILDLSNSSPEIRDFFSEKISREIFNRQMELFTQNKLESKFVQFYFEEAHNLFPSSDNDLSNIYNRLAKEGAKLNIGLVYSTQSISSLSRDLLKNTENFFIAHLNDQNEIKELTKFYEFKDVGIDVQKTKSVGFVRMITRSHKYALPVQIRRFGV